MEKQQRIYDALAPYPYIFYLNHSQDRESTLRSLEQRREGSTHWNRFFLESEAYEILAKLVFYTAGKTPDEILDVILQKINVEQFRDDDIQVQSSVDVEESNITKLQGRYEADGSPSDFLEFRLVDGLLVVNNESACISALARSPTEFFITHPKLSFKFTLNSSRNASVNVQNHDTVSCYRRVGSPKIEMNKLQAL